ncbi:hypothetical protein CR513_11532, partial [Mucuna pruriens]
MSPYRIVFGKACHLLMEIEHRAYWLIKRCNLAYDQLGNVVELKDEYTNNTFQVNGHQIKLFHEGPTRTMRKTKTISLMEPAQPAQSVLKKEELDPNRDLLVEPKISKA